MPKRMTPNQIAFQKELKRMERIVSRFSSQGITFLSSPVMPTPSRITKKQIIKAKSITPAMILARSEEYKDKRAKDIFLSAESLTRKLRANEQQLPESHNARFAQEKRKLSEEELYEIRRISAQKANLARQIREANDPVFREYMNAIRRSNIKKAQEANKSLTPEERKERAKKSAQSRAEHEAIDPEFKEQLDKVRRENLEKAREQKEWKKNFNIDDYMNKQDEDIYEYAYPSEADMILYNLNTLISQSSRKAISDWLLDLVSDEINEYGGIAVAERIKDASDDILEMCSIIAYDSDDEKVRDNTFALASLITAGNLPPNADQTIFDLVEQDMPYHRRRGMRQYFD